MNKGVKIRRIKVYEKILVRRQAYLSEKYNVYFPEIRLMGKWLLDCGFRPGQQIEVHTEEDKLTITKSPGTIP